MKQRLVILGSMAVIAAGCSKPPEQAMKDAENALLMAEGRKDCAQEKYMAAQQLLDEARTLVKAEEYDEAEKKARAAEKLAKEAKAEADANWEECNKRNEVVEKAKDDEDETPKEEPATLSTIFFAYDSAELTPSQRSVLDQNARWMRQNDASSLILEGHTDERGSVEYNIALGERRARSVQQYLLQLGIDSGRMRILSFGEEKPSSFGTSEEDYRQNRRVEFVPAKK